MANPSTNNITNSKVNANKAKPIVALIYDFDNTLIKGNMQEYGFIKGMGYTNKAFWKKAKELKSKQGIPGFKDSILAYMYLMIQAAREELKKFLTREDFHQLGKQVDFLPGVKTWAKNLRKEWRKELDIRHYVVSSGIKEIIMGTSIQKYFDDKDNKIKIYACEFHYNENDEAVWPAQVFNFTSKTQVLFLINKGLDDTEEINDFMDEKKRPVPFTRMLYYGDGQTDVPCMRLVKTRGGHAFAVHTSPKKKKECEKLVKEGRAHFAFKADYSIEAPLYIATQRVLNKVHADWMVANCGKIRHRKRKLLTQKP